MVDEYDREMKNILENLIENSEIRGAANIQAIVNENGEIVPFEINCRISGTNSIRSNFGFEDVKYTLEEWLYERSISAPKIKKGIATRILMDVIYENLSDFSEAQTNNTPYHLF